MNEFAKKFADDLLSSLVRQRAIADRKQKRERILSLLPKSGDKIQGKTRKQIAKGTELPPLEVGRHLQALKKQNKVRCYYQRKWRQAKPKLS